ncbi:MAG: hypothetical protein HY434_01875 [Candidatus Liptonbacteria bacterium]|nr:hypothetical protein [Parcubacteria group bacterium]MBI4087556.1 hypothetical protein [Candidatus Liptonbacteria bacterium]
MNDLQKAFIEARDIPYSIPLSYGAEDRCCSGKHKKLLEVFKNNGYEARWRVCTFKWGDMRLPANVAAVPHDDNSTHAYLEVKIGGEWKKVDATWDKPLACVLPVNDWNGSSDTAIAVPVISTYSPEESASMMDNENRKTIEADLGVNGKFYEAFNQWLVEVRQKSENNR